MATGDIIWFEECRTMDYYVDWSATDVIKCAVLDNTTAPTAADATPALADYTQVGTGGTYPAGGYTMDNWGTGWSEAGGTGKFDSSLNPTFAAHASNDTDAYWGLIYNDTQTGDPAFAYVELGGPVDMQAGSLTITWHANGIATLTAA